MSTTSHPQIPLWIQNRIVGFFNWARNVNMLLDGSIVDDPSDGPGTTMGPTLAARILRERNLLPNRRFTDLQQIDQIKGVGPGTIQDLVYSFGISADEAFKASMYESGTIHVENWPLEYFRFTVEDQQTFQNLAQDNAQLRAFILDKVAGVCAARDVSAGNTQAMLDTLANAYIDDFSNSTQAAGYALALWFYRFDADNWFSWEQIQIQTLAYFSHNSNTYPWMMDLHFFKGFENKGIISPGICPKDLPVVVNWAEQSLNFWISALYDWGSPWTDPRARPSCKQFGRIPQNIVLIRRRLGFKH